jgi:hypothetical protein
MQRRLSLFRVVGASKALHAAFAPAPATLVGLISCIAGGVLRDLLFSEVPAVLRTGLYAVPGLLGASVVTLADAAGLQFPWWLAAGALACFILWAVGQRWRLSLPHGVPSNTASHRVNDGSEYVHAPHGCGKRASELELETRVPPGSTSHDYSPDTTNLSASRRSRGTGPRLTRGAAITRSTRGDRLVVGQFGSGFPAGP